MLLGCFWIHTIPVLHVVKTSTVLFAILKRTGMHNFFRLNMRTKLLLGFVAIILLAAGAGIFLGQKTESETSMPVKLFYYNSELDKDIEGNIQCSRQGLVPVARVIKRTQTPIQDTVRLLLRGEITQEEKVQGVTSEFPLEGVSLTGASLKNGTLTLAFSDPQNRTSGGSCRAGILWFQIEATAKQFSEVQSVTFMPEELFQP